MGTSRLIIGPSGLAFVARASAAKEPMDMLGDAKKSHPPTGHEFDFLFCNCDHGKRTFRCVFRTIEDNTSGLARAGPKLKV